MSSENRFQRQQSWSNEWKGNRMRNVWSHWDCIHYSTEDFGATWSKHLKIWLERNVSTVSHSFSWLLTHITCVDTVWNCSCQGVRQLLERRSSAQELSVTGTLCHNMRSKLHQWIASRIDWTSTGRIWASKAQATRSSSSSIK